MQRTKERKKIFKKKSIQTIEFYQSKSTWDTWRLHGSTATITKYCACAQLFWAAPPGAVRQLDNNRNSIWMHLEPPLEASGSHLDASGTIWVASGRHLGGIREASGRHPSRAANKNYKMKVRTPPAPLIITILRIILPHEPSQSSPTRTLYIIMTLHSVKNSMK